jgi:hypothetical protein
VITQDAENQTLEEFTKKTLEQMKKIPNFPSETLKVQIFKFFVISKRFVD